MASHFKNRLVGIIILVASVVIFLPSIIDGKKMTYEDEFVATPIHPKLKKHSLKLDITSSVNETDTQGALQASSEQVDIIDESWHIEEMPAALTIEDAPVVTQEKRKNVQVDEQPVDITSSNALVITKEKVVDKVLVKKSVLKKKAMPSNAWTIQLGAFQNAANINALLKILHKAGFQAHTVPVDVVEGKLTRLFVGPDVSKEKLEKQLPRLKLLTKLTGKLQPFDAVNP